MPDSPFTYFSTCKGSVWERNTGTIIIAYPQETAIWKESWFAIRSIRNAVLRLSFLMLHTSADTVRMKWKSLWLVSGQEASESQQHIRSVSQGYYKCTSQVKQSLYSIWTKSKQYWKLAFLTGLQQLSALSLLLTWAWRFGVLSLPRNASWELELRRQGCCRW